MGQRKEKEEMETGNTVEEVALTAKVKSDQFLEYQSDCHLDLAPAKLSVHVWVQQRKQ